MPTAAFFGGHSRPVSAAASSGRHHGPGVSSALVTTSDVVPRGGGGNASGTSGGGWKHAGLTPGIPGRAFNILDPADDPPPASSALHGRNTAAIAARFSHVQSSGYSRVRPALTAANIADELDAARMELHYHATVAEQASDRIALLEETYASTTEEFHEKRFAMVWPCTI